ncbi:ATP-binding protein [Aliiroseovarius sp. 2305UL8-7]|uniref:ATP-binding protein n=1 Tax=Aliiroseovarius conchicola TaxID=3121637 RepID=UPI0035280D21
MARDVINAIPIPAMLVGSDLRIQAQNQAALSLFGADLVGRHVATGIRQPAILDAVEAVMATENARTARLLSGDAGRESTYDVHLERVGDQGVVLLTFLDVTSHEQAGQMRSDFVANVSHELRTPLTALSGFIETLRGPARDDPDARARFLDIMDAEANRMNRLVTDLLSLSRVEDMAGLRPKDHVELDQVVQMVMNALTPTATARDVSFDFQVSLKRPVEVIGDQDQLTQVMTNLIENAIKYGREGGSVHVCLTSATDIPAFKGTGVKITVTDEGEGIDPKHLGRLTERFYRVDSHRSREMGGTGLGLAIVKHIVNRHRGRLRIESQPGKGSTFTVVLPMVASSSSD